MLNQVWYNPFLARFIPVPSEDFGMKTLRKAVAALAVALAPCVAFAQEPRRQEPPAGGGRGGQQREPEIRPFDRVITKDAKSDEGVFTVHRIRDRVFYEIPK